MAYSDKVIDHYENPRNVGSFDKGDDAVGTGMVGAPACGDVMKLQIKVGADGLIEDAQFKTYGCGSAIASSSLVTEWVKGKTLDEAATIKNTQIARGAVAPAGEDPLLDPRRGRDQGGDRRLQEEARRRCREEREEGRLMAITLTDNAASHVQRSLVQARQGRRPAPGRAHLGLLGPRLQARVRRRRRTPRTSSSRATASRCSSTRRACRTSTAPSSTTPARA